MPHILVFCEVLTYSQEKNIKEPFAVCRLLLFGYRLSKQTSDGFLRPKGRGFSTNETECPNGVNDGSDKNVWKLAYKQAYC